jgi:carbamoyl-phosphate synthase large subunit
VRICRDKLAAYRHLSAAGIDTPRTWTLEQLLAMHDHDLPFFVKPRSGSAGAGLHLIETEEDLRQVRRWVDDPIIQEYVQGREYTMDVYTGLNGEPACVVPRLRLRVRGGEVCQSQVVLDPELIEAGREAVRALPGCVGVITIQCIRSPAGRIAVIEVNPRFGGGAPLSIAAGADFPRYILAQHLGRRIHVPPTARQDGLMMTRYDRSIFRKMPLA